MSSFHWPLAAFVAAPVIVGGIIGGSYKDELEGWYSRLRKPSWQPPASAFGTIWTVLYACTGVAAYLVWKHTGYSLTSQPMLWFGALYALNYLWPVTFFKQHNLQLAALVNAGLLAVTIHVARLAHSIHPTAGKVMIPVAVWTAFANVLHFVIMSNNSGNQAGSGHSGSGQHSSSGQHSGPGHNTHNTGTGTHNTGSGAHNTGGPSPGGSSPPSTGTGGGYNYQPPTTRAFHYAAKPIRGASRIANRGLGLGGRQAVPTRQVRAPALARACPAAATRSFAFV